MPINEEAKNIEKKQQENQSDLYCTDNNFNAAKDGVRGLAMDDDDSDGDHPEVPEGGRKSEAGLNTTEIINKIQAKAPLQVSVSNGHLKYAAFPVLAGHFLGDGILSAESEIDAMLDGVLSQRHRINLYPGAIGSSEVIISGDNNLKGCIIVGLGMYNELTSFELTKTVEQGVCRYLLDVNSKLQFKNNTDEQSAPLGISALVVGAGYGGLSVENSVRSVLQGIQNANAKLSNLQAGGLKRIEQVEFIELYEDRALSCLYTVCKIEKESGETIKISIRKKEIRQTYGSRKRIPAATAHGWWNRISVTMGTDTSDNMRLLQFGVYAGAAREEKKNVYIHPAGIESMIDECSTGNRWTPKLATTLFEILIPVDFKEQLKRQGNITWILDKNTAAYPWELLQDNTADAKPLSVNAGMIRQLDTMDYRLKINVVTGNTALVVGEPELDGFLTPLPGALQEAKAVADIIEQNGFMPTRLFKSNARDILQELHAGYKIVHLAGHGVFNKDAPQYSGMVIGKNYFLTTADISNMSTVPELVFLNCCHLGRTDGEAEAYYQNVYKMAANIGTQLIENGVKAVVAAGWAVSDAAALRFAQLFYEGMFDGDCFGDAVKKARAAIYEAFPRTNTWGAYQCYGDPFYKFRNEQKKKIQPAREFMIAAEAEIALDNLESAIKTGKYKQEQIPDELMEIATAVDKAGIRQAAITEREARLYSDLHHYDLAIAKFESLLSIEKADFAVSSLEKYYNTRMKKYIADYINEAAHENGINEAELKSWQTNTNEVLQGLESLLLISATAERYNLLGSTFKRKGILCINKTEKLQAYSRAAYYYHKANEKQHYNKGYALTNWYALESVLVLAADRSWSEIIQKEDQDAYILPAKEEVIKKLAEIKSAYTPNMQKMDYWVMVQVPNCMLCLLIVNSDTNEQVWNDVLNAYHDVWSKAGAQGDKFAEIEHLQLMADALQLNSTNNAALIKKLDSLKDDLQKMI